VADGGGCAATDFVGKDFFGRSRETSQADTNKCRWGER
jgi:hypothetical protein